MKILLTNRFIQESRSVWGIIILCLILGLLPKGAFGGERFQREGFQFESLTNRLNAAEQRWSKPLGGLQFGIITDKLIYKQGDDICVSVCYSNVSSKNIEVGVPAGLGWKEDYDIAVVDAKNAPVPLTQLGEEITKPRALGRVHSGTGRYMKPGEKWERDIFCPTTFYDLSKPGQYVIKATNKRWDPVSRTMLGVQETEELQIKILLKDKK